MNLDYYECMNLIAEGHFPRKLISQFHKFEIITKKATYKVEMSKKDLVYDKLDQIFMFLKNSNSKVKKIAIFERNGYGQTSFYHELFSYHKAGLSLNKEWSPNYIDMAHRDHYLDLQVFFELSFETTMLSLLANRNVQLDLLTANDSKMIALSIPFRSEVI